MGELVPTPLQTQIGTQLHNAGAHLVRYFDQMTWGQQFGDSIGDAIGPGMEDLQARVQNEIATRGRCLGVTIEWLRSRVERRSWFAFTQGMGYLPGYVQGMEMSEPRRATVNQAFVRNMNAYVNCGRGVISTTGLLERFGGLRCIHTSDHSGRAFLGTIALLSFTKPSTAFVTLYMATDVSAHIIGIDREASCIFDPNIGEIHFVGSQRLGDILSVLVEPRYTQFIVTCFERSGTLPTDIPFLVK